MITCDLPFTSVDLFATDGNNAVGDDARNMATIQREIVAEYLAAPWTGAPLRSGIQAVLDAAIESGCENWDGYGARPLQQPAILNAVRLLKRIPSTSPVEDVYVDADGDVLLEWRSSSRSSFTVAVNGRGELHFAGVFGRNRVRGREIFLGENLPEAVRAGIRRVFSGS
jgi:hypothetical protein